MTESQSRSEEPSRLLVVSPPFDLARTVAPAWWARGRWPNIDWQDGSFTWVGWEVGRIVWRSVRQVDARTLLVLGSGRVNLDRGWAVRVLGVESAMPRFGVPVLTELAHEHNGMKPWAAGSLYEGVISSVVGQSISVAAAATTERRLYALFNDAIELGGRPFWPAPLPGQLAAVEAGFVRPSGVTTKRADALVEVGIGFSTGAIREVGHDEFNPESARENLLAISGIGPWTVRSAFLWGTGDTDAHPTGDVALLRAVRRHFPDVTTLKELDAMSEAWKPHRGWAARLFWLDLLGFGG